MVFKGKKSPGRGQVMGAHFLCQEDEEEGEVRIQSPKF